MIAGIYEERGSVLNRLNPVIGFLAFTVLILVPALYLDPFTPGAFWIVGVLGAWPLARLSPARLLRRLLPYILLCAGLFLVNSLLYSGPRETHLLSIGAIDIYRGAVLFGASIALRVLCLITYSQVLASSTDPTLLTNSLIAHARIPFRFAYGVLAAYRFIPILAAELQQIRDAHRVRGAYRGGLRGFFFRARRIGVPLLVNGIRRAEYLALAMDARNFAVAKERSYYRSPELRPTDWVFFIAAVLTAVGIVFVLDLLGLSRGFLAGTAETLTGAQR